MADVTTRFRTFLLADASIAALVADRVCHDSVPQEDDYPYVWYRKRQTTHNPTLDSAAGEAADEFAFDVETVEIDNGRPLGELVRTRCNCFRGTFGDSTCQGIFVLDQSEGYEPFNVAGDDGVYVTPLDVTVHV